MKLNIPIFVISLVRAAERRADITARLQNSGLAFEMVDAFDGRAGLGEYEHQIRHDIARRNYGRKLQPGQLGCYISHYQLWQRIANMDIAAALVLEDDAVWNSDMNAVVKSVTECDWHWDLVNLAEETFVRKMPPKKVAIKKTICDLVGEYKLVLHQRPDHFTMAYLITPAGAAKLAAHALPIYTHADKYWNESWVHNLIHYTLNKPVAFHNEAASTLENASSKGKPFIIACTAWLNARIRSYRRRWFYFQNPPRRK